jgi:glycosyltransferase involved in cell wall biosynthesis
MRAADISLIISTYDRPDALDKVLLGVRLQESPPGEILIADDGSGPPTHELIERWRGRLPSTLRHLRQEDLGFRKTMILNQCLAAAQGPYVVMLDGDCVPHRKFIADHAEAAENGCWVQGRRCFVKQRAVPRFSIDTAPIVRLMAARLIVGWPKGIRWPFALALRNQEHRGIIGCNMGFWRKDLLAINGFDEDYSGWGMEDSDVGVRLYHLGRIRKFLYGRAIVFHLNHPQSDRGRLDDAKKRLAQTIEAKKVRCERGVDQYLTAQPKPS